MYTFGGRLSEPRASLLAGKGYVVLALAYFGYEDLPKKPKVLDLEYFEEAVSYLRRQPEVSVGQYVILSVSLFCFSAAVKPIFMSSDLHLPSGIGGILCMKCKP